ncbi:MAG: winged helix DNA-binding protein [Bacteroidota bacterium]|jgi:DNA-binding transcriptional regulator GbsR (MarR family)
MIPRLTSHQKLFVEEYGNLYASYGFKRLNGLIIGLLLTTPGPLSLGEIGRLLNRSKGLISEATRRLTEYGFIKKSSGADSRKDYYIADSDIFINVFHFNMGTVRKNISIAETFLHALSSDRTADTKRWKENLEIMELFYEHMNEFYLNFDLVWRKKKKTITKK